MVGLRVVVRRIVPDQTGPTGGPAFTDLLGTCESWDATSTTIRAADGTTTTILLADIVSGKPVPPRPSRFTALTDDEVELRATALFRPTEVERVGDWLLPFAGGTNRRPNSVLPLGDPGVPVDEALARATAFYAAHDRQPCARVVVGSAVHAELDARGWVPMLADEADTEVQLAGVAKVSRLLSGLDTGDVELADALTHDWLVGNPGAQANYAAVAAALDLPDAVFASITENGEQVARARINLADDWAFLADLTVQPGARRRGLARTVTAALVGWAAEHGASVLLLQVLADNEPAQALYASLGFERHHAYRYLTPA